MVPTESETFLLADVDEFLDAALLVDRDALVTRLEAADARLDVLAARISDRPAPGARDWSAKQVLAHIAGLSKLYGMLTYKVGSGALSEFELMPMVHLRDAATETLSERPVADLLAMIQKDHARTLAYARGATAEELRRVCRFDLGREMSAGEILRLALVSHVEQHVRQLEEALP